MQKAYNRINWANEPSEETPVNETNLNRMDSAIDTLDNRIVEMNMTMQEPVAKSAASAAAAKESENAAAASAAAAKTDAKKAEDAADRAVAVAGFTVDTSLNENSPNPVTNKAITRGIVQTGESGARNNIPYPYHETSHTENGIEWTDNGDGTIGVKGTATAQSTFVIRAVANNWLVPNGTYSFSGCPEGGSFGTYRLQLARYVDGTLTSYANEYGAGAVVEITDGTPLLIQFVVASGVTIDATVAPMLERGGVKHSFVPFYFGGAEKAKTAERLGDYDSDDFLKLNENGGTVSFTDYVAFKVKRNLDSHSGGVCITFANNLGNVGMIGFKNKKLIRTDASTWSEYEVFDTSNKPSGTYTGVTDAGLASSIQIGESGKTIGNLLYIETEDGFGLIGATGGAYFGPQNANQYQYFHDTDISYIDGILEILPGEASNIFNRSGVVYKYSLL